jgi:hypothetical protein
MTRLPNLKRRLRGLGKRDWGLGNSIAIEVCHESEFWASESVYRRMASFGFFGQNSVNESRYGQNHESLPSLR